MNVESQLARALRALQRLDEVQDMQGTRHHLIEAETIIGEVLGLSCTGEPAIINADGSVAGFDHSGDTCPIHEWLVESDQRGLNRDPV